MKKSLSGFISENFICVFSQVLVTVGQTESRDT
jgi:hypothetical protein